MFVLCLTNWIEKGTVIISFNKLGFYPFYSKTEMKLASQTSHENKLMSSTPKLIDYGIVLLNRGFIYYIFI